MRVLVADEQPIVRRTLVEFIADIGHRAEMAATGEEVFTLLAGGACADVLLADFRMPGRNGGRLIDQVHAEFPAVPIVLMSGLDSVLPAEEAISAGVYAYLRKPVRLSELQLLLVRIAEAVLRRGPRVEGNDELGLA